MLVVFSEALLGRNCHITANRRINRLAWWSRYDLTICLGNMPIRFKAHGMGVSYLIKVGCLPFCLTIALNISELT